MTRAGWWLLPATLGGAAVGLGVLRLARSPLLAELNAESSERTVGEPAAA